MVSPFVLGILIAGIADASEIPFVFGIVVLRAARAHAEAGSEDADDASEETTGDEN
jgi:hypothetical protein